MANNPETFLPLISTFVNEQVPQFVRQNHPKFVEYLKAFYEFMEQPTEPVGRIVSLSDETDVDTTTDQFFTLFKSTYLSPFPEEFAADRAFVVKRVKDLYAAKGTIPSIRLLFRIIYGEEITVFLPKTKLLRASDGKWQQNIKLFVEVVAGNINQFGRHSFIGETSGAIADVDFVETSEQGSFDVLEMFLISYEGTFVAGETIHDRETGELIATIFGIVDDIQITAPGDDYVVGDLIPIIDVSGVNAVAKVSQIDSQFPVASFAVIDGGNGYRVGDPVDFSGSGGVGAIANVNTIAITGTVNVLTTTIGEVQNTTVLEVSAIAIGDFGVTEVIDTGIITSIELVDPGINYGSESFEVDINPQTPTFGLPAGTGADVSANTINTGTIIDVEISNGGIGYTLDATTDFTGIGDGTATGDVIVTGGPRITGGEYRNTDGHLSSDMRLQDNVFWQNYSYEISSERSINEWRDVVKAVTHPAGYALFGNLCIQNIIQNPLRDHPIPVDKCILKLTQMPLNIDKVIEICYFHHLECQDYLIEPKIIGHYDDHEISIYAGITIEEFINCGTFTCPIIEEFAAEIIDDFKDIEIQDICPTVAGVLIGEFELEIIEDYAEIVLGDFFFGAAACNPCYQQRQAIIEFFTQPIFVSMAEGFRSTKGVPIIEDHKDVRIDHYKDLQLFDFFEFGVPFIDQYKNVQINALRDEVLSDFYEAYELDDIYRQCRSIVQGPFNITLTSFVGGLSLTLPTPIIETISEDLIDDWENWTVGDFGNVNTTPKYTQRRTEIEITIV